MNNELEVKEVKVNEPVVIFQDDTYKITADSFQFILSRLAYKPDENGEEKPYVAKSTYHTTLEGVVKALWEKKVIEKIKITPNFKKDFESLGDIMNSCNSYIKENISVKEFYENKK